MSNQTQIKCSFIGRFLSSKEYDTFSPPHGLSLDGGIRHTDPHFGSRSPVTNSNTELPPSTLLPVGADFGGETRNPELHPSTRLPLGTDLGDDALWLSRSIVTDKNTELPPSILLPQGADLGDEIRNPELQFILRLDSRWGLILKMMPRGSRDRLSQKETQNFLLRFDSRNRLVIPIQLLSLD